MTRQIETAKTATLAGIFANHIRLSIMKHLTNGPASVNEISAAIGQSQPVVSRQLALLRGSGVLACRPEGRWRRYELHEPEKVGSLLKSLRLVMESAAANASNCRQMEPTGKQGN